MRKTLVVLTAAALLAGACSKKTGGGVKLKTDTDSVAYVIGMNVGMNLMKMDSTINVNAVCEGIRDVFRQGTKFSAADAEVFYLRYMNYALPEKARAYEEQFLQDILKANRNYARTASGVTYTVEVLGDQEQIPASDRDSIALRYLIRTPTAGTSTPPMSGAIRCCTTLGGLLKGMKESVKLVGRGGKINAWIPSSAGYGTEGDKELGIQPNTTLYYEIELVDVDKYANWSRRSNLRR